MIIRWLGAGVVMALAMSGLTACSTPEPRCTLNKILLSPSAVAVKDVKAREMRADLSVGRAAARQLSYMKLTGTDLTLHKRFVGPPSNTNGAVFLQEGHKYRVTVTAVLLGGRQLVCGTKTVSVPVSGASTPVITPTPQSASA